MKSTKMLSNIEYDSEKKFWSSPKRVSIFNENASIGQIVLSLMRSRPSDMICQISDTEQTTLTNSEAIDYAILIAEHLRNIGLTESDVVGLVTPNTTFFMPIVVACWLNCIPYHPISPNLSEDYFRSIFCATKPKVIFCDGNYYKKVKTITSGYNVYIYTLRNSIEGVPTVEEIFKTTKSPTIFQPIALKYGPNQTVAIYSSSGTTGNPKCIPYSNRRLIGDSAGSLISPKITYMTSTTHWISSVVNLLFCTIYGSKCIISSNTKPSAEYIYNLVKKYDVTFLSVTPWELYALSNLPSFTKNNLPNLKCALVGGSSNSAVTLKRLKEKFSEMLFFQNYASTETASIASDCTIYETNVLGKLLPGVQVKIINPETKEPLGYNQNGEICSRRDETWPGYIGNESATLEVLDSDGWIHTGDMGLMDENNVLRFYGRFKDLMRYKNFQFSPFIIECTIQELPGVISVCVFSVTDEKFGDLAAAAVLKSNDSSLTEKHIMDYVAERQHLEHNRLHYGVFFVNEILRNDNGKILRKEMKNLCLEQAKSKKS